MLRHVVAIGLGCAALLGAVAALELRPLHADGFHYLNRILETEFASLPSPGRRLTELAMQAPLLAAIVLGVGDVGVLASIFALGLQLLPLALTASCWAMLPAGRKHFMIFPLAHYFAGTAGAAFALIAAGPTAAAIFWLMLFYILFRMQSTRAIDLAPLLALATFAIHESFVFLGPLLAVASFMRLADRERRADRVILVLAALLFLAAAAVQGYYIAHPAHPGYGSGQLRNLLNGSWLMAQDGQVNVPAVIGIAGLFAIAALWAMARRDASKAGWVAVAAFGLFAAAATGWLVAEDRFLAAAAQFAARNNAALISLPLGIATLALAHAPARFAAGFARQSAAAVGVMAVAALAWDANATRRWSHYIAVVRGILADNRGFVEWQTALDMLPAGDRRLLLRLTHPWTVSPLCFALSPNGRVKAILGESRPQGWRPYDPRDPAQLPRSRFWSTAAYRAALAEASADPDGR